MTQSYPARNHRPAHSGPRPLAVRLLQRVRASLNVNALAAALIALMLVATHGLEAEDVLLTIELRSELPGAAEIFYASEGEPFVPLQRLAVEIRPGGGWHRYPVHMPGNQGIARIRVDPGSGPGDFSIGSLTIASNGESRHLDAAQLRQAMGSQNQVSLVSIDDRGLAFESLGSDPGIEIRLGHLPAPSWWKESLWKLLLALVAAYLAWVSIARIAAALSPRAGPLLDRIGAVLSDSRLLVFERGSVLSFAGILAAAILYICLNLNQSSIGIWERVFPDRPVEQAVDLGTPKLIRSDEWTVQTPWALNQVAAGFPRHNPNIGGEAAPILAAMPLDGLLGLPQAKFWGFHLLAPDRGFSWWWAYKTFGMLGAFLWMLLLLTRGNLAASWLGSVWIYASSFTQWWFSSSLPEIAIAFAISVVGAIYTLYSSRPRLVVTGCVLVAYGATNLLLHLYPPAIVSLGYLGVALLAGYSVQRSGSIRISDLAMLRAGATAITVSLLAVYALHYYSAAEASICGIMSTVYPGRRVSTGGQFPIEKLASGLFEGFRLGESRVPLKPTNASEASGFLLLAPLVLLLVPLRRLVSRSNALLLAVIAFLALCFCWIAVRLPGPLESLLQTMGWQYVTSKRAVFAFGIGSITACVLMLDWAMCSTADAVAPGRRVAAVCAVAISTLALGWWLSRLDAAFFTRGTIAAGVICSTSIAAGIALGRPALAAIGLAIYMMATMAVNPLMSGLSSMTGKPVLVAARSHSTTHSKWLVVGEPFFSQGLKALGLNAFGGYLYQPDMAAVAVLDPSHRYEHSWNRYARVRVTSVPQTPEPVFKTTWGDQYTIEISVCGPHVRKLGITHVAYTSPVPDSDLACLEELTSPEDSGVRLFTLRGP